MIENLNGEEIIGNEMVKKCYSKSQIYYNYFRMKMSQYSLKP